MVENSPFLQTMFETHILIVEETVYEKIHVHCPELRMIVISDKPLHLRTGHYVFPCVETALLLAKQLDSHHMFMGTTIDSIYPILQRNDFEYLYLVVEWSRTVSSSSKWSLSFDRFESVDPLDVSSTTTLMYKMKGYFHNPHDMTYFRLVRKILRDGKKKKDRTGTGTISIFGYHMEFDISESLPLLTSKWIPYRSCIHEFLWFLKGKTDVSDLQKHKVFIWDEHSSKSFLKERGLDHLPEGDIGASYGFQWRHFGANYKTCKENYGQQGFDQLEYMIQELKTNPSSRRIFMTAWNPLDLHQMALSPCHVSVQFAVDGEYLSCHLYQRSMDVFLGAPWNILSYSLLTYYLCSVCHYKPHRLFISIGDAHIYRDHVPQMKQQLLTLPYMPPILRPIPPKPIDELTVDDFVIENYQSNPRLYGKMSV